MLDLKKNLDLEKKTVKELRNLAKEQGIRGFKKLKKADLINAINKTKPTEQPTVRVSKLKKLVEDASEDERETTSSFKGNYKRLKYDGVEEGKIVDLMTYLENTTEDVKKDLQKLQSDRENWKVQLNVVVEFLMVERRDDETNEVTEEKPMWSSNAILMEGSNISKIIKEMHETLLLQYGSVSSKLKSSGFVFNRIVGMTCHCNKVDLNRGSSYFDAPDWIKNKGCIINPQNKDDKCFIYAVTLSLHHHQIDFHPERISKIKPFINKYNWDQIQCPATNKDWETFEKNNPDVALNVLFVDLENKEKKVYQSFISKFNLSRNKIADILILRDNEKSHYVAIKSLPALLRGITSKHNGDFYCRNCLNSFRTENKRDIHIKVCLDNDYCKVEMPNQFNNKMKYFEGQKAMRSAFVIYADTECILQKIETDKKDSSKPYTQEINKHVGCGYSMFLKFAHGDLEDDRRVYRGKDSMSKFCEDLRKLVMRAINYPQKEMIELTKKELKSHNKSKKCHICFSSFKEDELKVKDHCHYTGKYRGAAHNECNLNYKIQKFVPVIFHNRANYDDHLIIKELAKEFKSEDFECLGENSEKYISFSVKIKNENEDTFKIRFLDSFKFMPSSLSSHVNNLAETNNDGFKCCEKSMEFVEINADYKAVYRCNKCSTTKNKQLDKDIITKKFKNTYSQSKNDSQFRLLLRKGVYPYEYMDSWEKFDEKTLPSIKNFYSNLNLENITNTDYEHAKKVWNTFKLKSLGEYHDLYVLTDTLLLADVFENFRDLCLEIYGLDPCYFYTAPGLSLQAALKTTKQELQLLTDIDMLLMIESGIRGGICQPVKNYAKANNKYMKNFDKNIESSYIMYWDANNLYGKAMCEKLPTNGFKWVNEKFSDINKAIEFVLNYKNGDKGYILEVDVHVPKKLQKLHNDLPFLAEQLKLNKHKKLTTNLYDKTNYVVHIRTLQQALKNGLVLTKVHKAIQFEQSAWLKPYIIKNNDLRTKAKNDFEKDFFKLMNNSLFGKTMENVRKQKDIRLVTLEEKRKKLASLPNYHSTNRFDENLLAMELRKLRVKMNKPVYLGFSILELSKITMYKFHYDYIKPKYNERANLCYMDTDSLIYHIKTDDVFKDISDDVTERFDTSNYCVDRPLPTNKNKKVLAMMKDEMGGIIIIEFVALAPKMYAFRTDNFVEKKAKGVKKCVVKKEISFDDYLSVYETKKAIYKTQNRFKSKKHTMFTVEQNKVALNIHNDKRLLDGHALGTSVGIICEREIRKK